MPNLDLDKSPGARRWLLVVWPAFLAACLLEAVVFSMVDPGAVHWPWYARQPSRQAVYTLAFFIFWLISMTSSAMVLWLAESGRRPPDA